MNRSLLLVALLALALPQALAAQLVVGFGAGIRSSSLAFDPEIDGLDESRTGIAVSGFVGIPLGETFRIQPGIGYAQKGAKETLGSAEAALEIDYIEVPVLGVFSPAMDGAVGFHLCGGPYLGLETGCSISGEEGGVSLDADCEEADIDTKSVDFGAVLGAALSYATSETMSVFVAASYGLGLANVADSEQDDSAKHRSFGAQIGLAFRTGG